MAITPLTSNELQEAIGSSDSATKRLVDVVKAMVDNYANFAPQEIKNEAMIRLAGWLHELPPGVAEMTVEGAEISYRGGVSALRHSGAMALLSPWKKRRARVIG